MMSNIRLKDVFMFLETFEKGLNLAGYIPVIGTVSASVRAVYAKIEVIVGLALMIFSAGLYLQGNPHQACLMIGATFWGHGVLNTLRSYMEFTPFLPLITTLPYDLIATFWVGKRFFSYV